MPTISGKWRFNETISNVSVFGDTFWGDGSTKFISNGAEFNSIRKVNDGLFGVGGKDILQYFTSGVSGYTKVYTYGDKVWEDEAYRDIEWLSPFEASEEFYTWFAANAVPLDAPEPEQPEEPEEPETPTLTSRDLYRKINGQLVKHTLYKKVGGELVKVDEYST